MAITRKHYNVAENKQGYGIRGTLKSTVVEFEGCVLEEPERRHERVMSDVYADVTYAKVWDAAEGCVKMVQLMAHFELTYLQDVDCVVDATDEVRQLASDWQDEQARILAEAQAKRAAEEAEREARLAKRGRWVQVIRKNKRLPEKGTIGLCIWTGTSASYGTRRMGMKPDPESETVFWGPASCVRALTPEEIPKPKPIPTVWDRIDS